MKTKAKKELLEKTKEELQSLLKDAQADLFLVRIEHARKKLKNTRSLFQKRKDIAIIKTFLQRKEEMT